MASLSYAPLRCDASQRIILVLQLHPFKGIQKNILKAWIFNKYKLCHRSFDKNLRKNYQTEILKSDTAYTFDGCFNCPLMLRQLTDLNFHHYLLSEKYILLKFKSSGVSTSRGTCWTYSCTSDGTFCENS